MAKANHGTWIDNVTGTESELIVKGNPLAKKGTIIGIGMAIGGVILASLSGWHSGTNDFHDAQSKIFENFDKIRAEKQ